MTKTALLLSAVPAFVAGAFLALVALDIRDSHLSSLNSHPPSVTYVVSPRTDGKFSVEQWTTHPTWGHVEVGRFAARAAAEIHASELRGETSLISHGDTKTRSGIAQ